jgi:hypothetical protein
MADSISITGYVDDNRVFGDTEHEWNQRLDRAVAIYQAPRIKDPRNPHKTERAAQLITSLGIAYDLRTTTSYVPASSIQHPQGALNEVRTHKTYITKRQLWSYTSDPWPSSINFALPGSLARFSRLLVYSGTDDWEHRYHVPKVSKHIREANTFFRTQGPMPLQHHRTKLMDLFPDATTTQVSICHPD